MEYRRVLNARSWASTTILPMDGDRWYFAYVDDAGFSVTELAKDTLVVVSHNEWRPRYHHHNSSYYVGDMCVRVVTRRSVVLDGYVMPVEEGSVYLQSQGFSAPEAEVYIAQLSTYSVEL